MENDDQQWTKHKKELVLERDFTEKGGIGEAYKEKYQAKNYSRGAAKNRAQRDITCGSNRYVSLGSILGDRKSTRLNSSHTVISYAVFCLKKKNMPILVVHTSSVPL